MRWTVDRALRVVAASLALSGTAGAFDARLPTTSGAGRAARGRIVDDDIAPACDEAERRQPNGADASANIHDAIVSSVAESGSPSATFGAHISGAKNDAWVAANADNPLRDGVDDDEDFGERASQPWVSTCATVARVARCVSGLSFITPRDHVRHERC